MVFQRNSNTLGVARRGGREIVQPLLQPWRVVSVTLCIIPAESTDISFLPKGVRTATALRAQEGSGGTWGAGALKVDEHGGG